MTHRDRPAVLPEDLALFENDAFGVAIVRDGVVERCNAKLERMHGCEPGGLIGRRFSPFHNLASADASAHSRSAVVEAAISRGDGRCVWARATSRETLDARGVRQTLWIVEDLTQCQEARSAAQRARQRALGMALYMKRRAATMHDCPAPWRRDARRDLQFEDRLRRAVRDKAFELHYQPIVDLRRDSVCAMEALLRWRTVDGQWVSPAEFSPMAEASGLIHPLGRWSLAAACRQASAWCSAGLPRVPISVNLSPLQLRQADLVKTVFDTLDETGVDPGLIEFEITETSLMHDIDGTLPKLQRIVEGGIRLAIDDFGTGYASLNYLRRLPIAKLKIDRSFVLGLHERADVTIVSAVIQLARGLGLTTVAEGVETHEQLGILRALGCDCCQGYYFFRPSSASEVIGLIDESAHMPLCENAA